MKDKPQLVFSLYDRNLTKTEFDLLKKLEFEYLYRQIRSFLTASTRLLFKETLMTLYSRYTGNFFQQRRKHPFFFIGSTIQGSSKLETR